MQIDVESLTRACSDDSFDGGVTIRTELEPLGGPGVPVKPPTYAGATDRDGPRYQHEQRWWDDGDGRRVVGAVLIDNVPSQANRAESALLAVAEQLGLPELVLDLSSVGELPPHLPRTVSSLQFPHRHADGYLRDALLDGTPFPKTEEGRALFGATADRAQPLLRWTPQSLIYGFWQSHLGKGRSQAKLARSWRSEIVGYQPAETEVRQLGLKGDPLNLAKGAGIQVDEDDPSRWAMGTEKPAGAGTVKKKDLSDIGHGQVPVGGDGKSAPVAVSFGAIEQRSTLSLPDLRRVSVGEPKQNAAARALLVALALVGHTHAHTGAFTLRSGADLRVNATRWTWLGPDGDADVDPLAPQDTLDLFDAAVTAAAEVGLPVGAAWDPRVLTLSPSQQLAKAIMATYPQAD